MECRSRVFITAQSPRCQAFIFQKWLRERLLRYFSFQAIFEERVGC